MATNDMRTFSLAEKQTATMHNWPSVNHKGLFSSSSGLKTALNLLEDLQSLISGEEPYSVQADEEGLEIGEFVVQNANLAKAVEAKRKELEDWLKWHDWFDKAKVSVTYFKNWANNAEKSNGLMIHAKPTSVDQVRKLVEGANALNIKVGCGGAYHSWSPLFPDKSTTDQVGMILSMYELELESKGIPSLCNKQNRIRINEEKTEVTIAPGVTTGELMEFFNSERVCFFSDVILMNVTYGGVLSTGCHGVGKDQQIMSDWITSMKVVDFTGKLREYPKDFPDNPKISKKDFMNALRVHMGLFGVVVEFTVKVLPLPTAKVQTMYPTLGALLYGDKPGLRDLLRNHWSLQFMWFPFNSLGLLGGLVQGLPFIHVWQPKADEVLIRAIDQDERYHETAKFKRLQQKVIDTVEHIGLDSLGTPLIKRYPAIIPAFVAGSFSLLQIRQPEGEKFEELTHAIHFRHGISEAPVYDMEFAFTFNLEDDGSSFKKVLDALKYVVEETEKEAKLFHPESLTQNYPLSTTMDLRIISRSDTLLAPASKLLGDTDNYTHTAFIEVLSFAGTDGYKEFFRKVGQKWMELGGVPHWCKQWTFLEQDGIFEHIRKYYGQNLTLFKEIFTTLNKDDDGKVSELFVNSTMKQILQL